MGNILHLWTVLRNYTRIFNVCLLDFCFYSLTIVHTETWKEIASIQGTKACYLSFSPKSTYLISWEQFYVTKDDPQGKPNLNIYKCENGELVKSFVHKKQGNW